MRPSTASGLLVLLAALLLACAEESTPPVTPFTGEQIDRIDASVRAARPPNEVDPDRNPPPQWVSILLRDDRERMIVHVRLALPGDLRDIDLQGARCAAVEERIREHLLPGQQVEMYLVFDEWVHACTKGA